MRDLVTTSREVLSAELLSGQTSGCCPVVLGRVCGKRDQLLAVPSEASGMFWVTGVLQVVQESLQDPSRGPRPTGVGPSGHDVGAVARLPG